MQARQYERRARDCEGECAQRRLAVVQEQRCSAI